MENEYTTAAEFYRICAAAVEIFGRKPANKIYECNCKGTK